MKIKIARANPKIKTRARRKAPSRAITPTGVATFNPEDTPNPELNESMRKVLTQFRVVFRSTRHHYQQVERLTGVGGAEVWVLAHVAENSGIKVGELAKALAVHPSTASNLVRKLDAAGLLTRQRIAEDQRTVRLQLTRRGKSVLKRAPKPLIGVLQQALMEMPPNRLNELSSALLRLLSILDAESPAYGPGVVPDR